MRMDHKVQAIQNFRDGQKLIPTFWMNAWALTICWSFEKSFEPKYQQACSKRNCLSRVTSTQPQRRVGQVRVIYYAKQVSRRNTRLLNQQRRWTDQQILMGKIHLMMQQPQIREGTYEQVCRILGKVTIIPHHTYIDSVIPKNILLPCRFWYVNSQPTGETQFSNFKNCWIESDRRFRRIWKVIVRMLLTMGHIFERLISFWDRKRVGSGWILSSFQFIW